MRAHFCRLGLCLLADLARISVSNCEVQQRILPAILDLESSYS
jgi:hypothetical protein